VYSLHSLLWMKKQPVITLPSLCFCFWKKLSIANLIVLVRDLFVPSSH